MTFRQPAAAGAAATAETIHRPAGFTIHPGSLESLGPALFQTGTWTFGNLGWPLANLGIYVPFYLGESITVDRLFVSNGAVVAGSFDIGIFDNAGVRLVSSGAIAQAGVNNLQVVNVADTDLAAGRYFLALAFDGVAANVEGWNSDIRSQKMLGLAEEAAAMPLPANATFATYARSIIPIFGLVRRTLV